MSYSTIKAQLLLDYPDASGLWISNRADQLLAIETANANPDATPITKTELIAENPDASALWISSQLLMNNITLAAAQDKEAEIAAGRTPTPMTAMEVLAIYPDAGSLVLANRRELGEFSQSRLPGFYAQPEIVSARQAFMTTPENSVNYFNYFGLLMAGKLANGELINDPANGTYPAIHNLAQFDPLADAAIGKWQAIHDPGAQKDLTWHGLVIGAVAIALAASPALLAETAVVQDATFFGYGVGGDLTTAAGLTTAESLAASALAPVTINAPLSLVDIGIEAVKETVPNIGQTAPEVPGFEEFFSPIKEVSTEAAAAVISVGGVVTATNELTGKTPPARQTSGSTVKQTKTNFVIPAGIFALLYFFL